MGTKKILIIEDDLLSRINLEQKLITRGEVLTSKSKEETKAKIKLSNFDIAFVDLDLDRELEGLRLISMLKEKNIYTVILSAREEEEIIRKAYENGCDDYLVKPFSHKSIDLVFKKYNQKSLKTTMVDLLANTFQTLDENFLSQIEIIANSLLSDRPILISGETGTGKTFLAKVIHELSGQHLPFVQLNCSEFSETLLESELFGHEKGAFTGAIKSKKGLIELAHDGILFLDEIGTMSITLQKKLLKALEEKVFYPVGSEKAVKSNFRLISATCDDLKAQIENGEFRQDLFYRIEGFNIAIPALRERKKDINQLIKSFIKKSERRFVIDSDAMTAFENYQWPGNVRELQKVIDVLGTKEKGIIELDDVTSILNQKKIGTKAFKIDIEEVKRVGLNSYVENIEMEIVSLLYESNNEKVRKTLNDLKLSNNTFYRIMENIKSRNNHHVS
jgi:DNA-binding NtrC family response regulator